MLLLPGQTGEAGKASQKQYPFGNWGVLDRKFLLHFFLSFRVLQVSEDHCCAVYTKTYASDAMRLYGWCVPNFYTPLRWITNTTFVPLHPLVVSPFCARSVWAGWVRGPVWTWWRREKSFTLPAIEHMSPPLDTLTWPPRAGLGPAEKFFFGFLSKGGPPKNIYTKSVKLSVAEWLGFGLKVNLYSRQIMILPKKTKCI